MCGLAGFWGLNTYSEEDLLAMAKNMAVALQHRGPDDTGVWADAHSSFAISHRRLSIVDRSAAGHQPMHSVDGRFVIAFNGEIYNHVELRADLEGIDSAPLPKAVKGSLMPRLSRKGEGWRGHSDTETLLAGFEAWGVEATLKKSVGMFAIALWDNKDKTLTLARDRFGEKPLYYGWVNGAFVFGSEIKALRAYPGFINPVCRKALSQYMRFSYVPAPMSIYQDIFKLEPGCLLILNGLKSSLKITRWWVFADLVKSGQQNPITDEIEAVNALEQCLVKAVQLQSLADVPLGAFLSGGVDSSTIVALMQKQTTRQVKTFTVGFEEDGFDESPYAKAVAQHLGTDHSELFVSSREAQAVIPQLPEIYDEPFADSSQIPTHLVCKAARQQVTVALSGDAGDELFGGYNRYFWGPSIWSRLAWLPYQARQVLGKALTAVPATKWNDMGSKLGLVRPGEKFNKLGRAISGVRNLEDLYRNLVSVWQDPGHVVKGALGNADVEIQVPSRLSAAERMMYLDSMSYLSDDILCKVDRAAMAASLESRAPFLDHRVAEMAWRLPLHLKIRGNQGKWVLRQVLYKYIPRGLIDRPKAGFSIPIGQWLRWPLRDWAEALLDSKRLQSEGYFYVAPIRTLWAEHLSGQRDHTNSLWTVLMFQAWLEANKST